MTPRSRKYFAGKKRRYIPSLFENLIPIFDALNLCKDAWLKFATPVAKRPENRPPVSAIVGEVGPELLMSPNGQLHMTYSRLLKLPHGIAVMPISP